MRADRSKSACADSKDCAALLVFPPVLHQPEDATEHQELKEAKGFVLQQIVRDGYGIDLWSVTSLVTLNVEFAKLGALRTSPAVLRHPD